MAEKLTAPLMGEGVEEITLVKWLKGEGDRVKKSEPIVEVETDKVVTELPCPAGGVLLKTTAEEGATIKVGDLLAWIGEPGEEIPEESKEASKEAIKETPASKEKPKQAVNKTSQIDTFLSPVVRKIAEENAIDLDELEGTGKDGRITKRDVLAYLEAGEKREPSKAAAEETPKKALPSEENLRPLSSVRRTIAERMVQSQQTSAHVLTVMETDMSRVLAHRAHNKPLFDQDGVRLTLTAYFISAIVEGLQANPTANSSWGEEGLIMHPDINIGMAVTLGKEGLIVPVIKQADTLSLLGIARQVNDLAECARSKQLKPEDVRDGTFTLTNHGHGGSLFASPIIFQPQIGILGTGRMHKRPVVVQDENGNEAIAIRPMVYLSFVFDHRVLDGEGADAFLSDVKDKLENWE